MIKKIKITTLLFIFIFSFAIQGYCFLGLIGASLSFVGSQIGSLISGVTGFGMIKDVIGGVKSIQNSYDDVTGLINDVQGIGSIGQDAVNMLQGQVSGSVQDAWQGAGKDNPTVGKYLDQTEQKSIEYMQKNWAFGDEITKRIKQRDEQLAKTFKKVESKNEKIRESGQGELNAIMVGQNQDQQRILLKLVELQLRNQELEKELKAQNIKMNEDEQTQNEKSMSKILQDRQGGSKNYNNSALKSLQRGVVGERQY